MIQAIVVILLASSLIAGNIENRVEYLGGTLEQPPGQGGSLSLAHPETLTVEFRGKTLRVPYDRVNLVEYGQNVNRRLGLAIVVSPLFLLSKARKHFLTIGFQDSQGRQQAMVFRVDKGKIRTVLASLEARTGLKVQYQDEEARKAGKG